MSKSSKRLRQIYDNIYGYINFPREDFDFILKDPFFLRLHNLKQMGLAYYVYPDALHSRFAHSIGVYTNVCKIIDSQNQITSLKTDQENDKYKIQLSALLHDIGHVPLSHTIERALNKFDNYEKEIKGAREHSGTKQLLQVEEEELQKEESSVVKLMPKESLKVALHERLGEAVLENCNIGHHLRTHDIAPLEISAGFKGDIAFAYQQEHESTSQSFFNSQIRNFLHSQLDADRIDYLLRDASFSGVNTGSIDIDKLLNSIFYDKSNYGVDVSAIRALDQFFISRYVAYCQIVGNKKVMAFEYMASDFYYRLLLLRKKEKYHLRIRLYSYQDLVSDILPNKPEEFLTFTDDYFFSLIREVVANKEDVRRQDKLVVEYAEMLTKGQPLSAVTYIEGFDDNLKNKYGEDICFIEFLHNESMKEESDILNKVAHEAGIDKSEIIIPDPMKITLYTDERDPVQVFENGEVILENVSHSPASLLWMLKDKKYCIYRIYTLDKNNRGNLRNALLAFAKEYNYKNFGDLK